MLSSPRLAALVFDMDGTLLDSLPVQLESYRRAIVGSGGRDYSDAEILEAFHTGSAAVMLEALIGLPVGAEAVDRYEAYLRANAADVSAYPGISTALTDLSGNFRLGVFTAADTSAAETLLAATGLRSSFDVVIGADKVERTKPAPDGLLLACEALGARATECAYIGDAPVDVQVARACGAVAVAAGWGGRFAVDRSADIVVNDPGDLVRSLAAGSGVSFEPT
ncbi:MAG: hypothetical protein QOI81_1393 [Actinomycetota bacterium]|nr:hypothetical protein [Actinomycetota bacterium]